MYWRSRVSQPGRRGTPAASRASPACRCRAPRTAAREQIGHQAALQLGEVAQHVAPLLRRTARARGRSCCRAGGCARRAGRTRTSACRHPPRRSARSRRCRGSRSRSRTGRATARRAGSRPSTRRWRCSRRPSARGTAARPPWPSGRRPPPRPRRSFSSQQLEDGLVVQVGVVVVHLERVGAVVIDHVGRDALAEIGLEAVHAHVDQRAQLVAEPAAGRRGW